MLSLFSRRAGFGLLIALGLASAATAQTRTPSFVECSFGQGSQTSHLTLIVPDAVPQSTSRTLEISALPSGSPERPAVADLVPTISSELGEPYVRILFSMSDELGFVTKVARNGDAYTFSLDRASLQAGPNYFGGCDNPGRLFAMWR